jgi:hypothetical protein
LRHLCETESLIARTTVPAHTISVTGTGVTPTGGRPLPGIVGGGGWVCNGSAAMSGSDLVLTPAVANTGGSAVYSTPVSSIGAGGGAGTTTGPA